MAAQVVYHSRRHLVIQLFQQQLPVEWYTGQVRVRGIPDPPPPNTEREIHSHHGHPGRKKDHCTWDKWTEGSIRWPFDDVKANAPVDQKKVFFTAEAAAKVYGGRGRMRESRRSIEGGKGRLSLRRTSGNEVEAVEGKHRLDP